MALSSLSPAQLAEYSSLRRQIRDLPGLAESRPGVFAAAGSVWVQFLVGDDGEPVARLAPEGQGPIEWYVLADALCRRSLIEALRLRVRRLSQD